MTTLLKVLRKISVGFAWVGSILIGVVMVLTVLDAFGRYFLNRPLVGTVEVSESSMVILVFSALAYCHFTIEHVSVGVNLERFGKRVQFVGKQFASVVALVYFGLLTWQSGKVALYSFKIKETSWGSYPLPLYVGKLVIAAGAGLMFICLVVEMLTFLRSEGRKIE